MKQVFIRKGKVIVDEVPAPLVSVNEVLVHVYYSCISSGTEVSGIEKSGKPLLKKIIDNPQNIRKVLDLLKNKGLSKTIRKVKSKVDSQTPTGYSASGLVLEVGENIKNIKVGDKVACAGAGIANHAEFVAVPENLVVKMSEELDFQSASSVALGAIAFQGLRRADVKLGENIAVIGLGLLGQILVQLLKAAGARVIGFDIDDGRLNLAKELGMEEGYNSVKSNVLQKVLSFTHEKGVDITIITASAPHNNQIIQQAMEITRKKGKVVVVGDVGLGPKRFPFYEKEIDYLISTSYGPGRYDKDYEEKGIDYPFAYVRWTERRNMEEYLRLLAEGKVNFRKLISKTFSIEEAPQAYKFLEEGRPVKPAVLLNFHFVGEKPRETKIQITSVPLKKDVINVGVIGTGGFAKAVHLPNLKKLSNLYSISAICDLDGVNAKQVAKKFGARYCTTNYTEVLEDKNTDMVIVTLPHSLHAKVAIEAAKAGKAVFCEKPMALNEKELQELVDTLKESRIPYLAGFNRRFSPFAKKIKEIIKNRENPMIIDYQMNAGFLPKDHWTQSDVGGGRNIGEACHIYDLFTYFTESEVEKISAFSITSKTEKYLKNDNFVASLKFRDGSVCNLIYTAIGSRDFPKEQMKIYFDEKMIFLDDYKEIKIFGAKIKGFETKQDKGHFDEIKEFAKSIKERNGYPIPLWQLIQATKLSFEVEKQVNI